MGACSCSFFNNDKEELHAAPYRVNTFITQEKLEDWYTIDDDIGSTELGTMRLVHSKSDSKQYEVRTLYKSGAISYIMNELSFLRKLEHPNIEKIYEVFETSDEIHVVADTEQGSTLTASIHESGRFSEEKTASIAKQILSGLNYIHSKGICHRNLKLDVINLIDREQGFHVQIGGFAFAEYFMVNGKLVLLDRALGTPLFTAPEVYTGFYTAKCDMWSLGVIVYFLLFGIPPFGGLTDQQVLRAASIGAYVVPRNSVSNSATSFIEGLLEVDSIRRMSSSQALEHDWLANV